VERDVDKARAWQQRAARAYAARQTPRRLPQRSARMQAAYAGPDGRRALVARLLADNPVCQLRVTCQGAPAVDVDEIVSRARGGSILDPANCQTACRACHDWKHANPVEAERLGLSRHSWDRPTVLE
jgi:5-methylcytosine-specific restriction endonuclease McrA